LLVVVSNATEDSTHIELLFGKLVYVLHKFALFLIRKFSKVRRLTVEALLELNTHLFFGFDFVMKENL